MTNKPAPEKDDWTPQGYDQSTIDNICDRLADGESLRKICLDKDTPTTSTVFKWLAKSVSFAEQYARARESQADALFDDCLDIADNGTKALADATDRRLQIDTRKWMAGKLKGKYSDKVKHVGGDDDDDPIRVAQTTKLDVGGLTLEQLRTLASIPIPAG
tara:strand:+ start:2702 stop:3181 length:480 start_codon:yes stop_codon:yes gene_type:complete